MGVGEDVTEIGHSDQAKTLPAIAARALAKSGSIPVAVPVAMSDNLVHD